VSPYVIRSRQLRRHDGGNTLKSQDHHEGLRPLPRNAMECGIFRVKGGIRMRNEPVGNPLTRKICKQKNEKEKGRKSGAKGRAATRRLMRELHKKKR
jgi:hypothetical protein